MGFNLFQREHSILGSVISALGRTVNPNANRSNSLTVPTNRHTRLSPTISLRYPNTRKSPGTMAVAGNDVHLFPLVKIEFCNSPTDTTISPTPRNSSVRVSSLSSSNEDSQRRSGRSAHSFDNPSVMMQRS